MSKDTKRRKINAIKYLFISPIPEGDRFQQDSNRLENEALRARIFDLTIHRSIEQLKANDHIWPILKEAICFVKANCPYYATRLVKRNQFKINIAKFLDLE